MPSYRLVRCTLARMGDEWRSMLRVARRKVRISQQRLADNIGLSLEAVRGYETGRRKPSSRRLEQIITALKVPNADANAIREDAGFASIRNVYTNERDANYYYTVDEYPAVVEEAPWPEFVLNDAMEVVATNKIVQALWGIDFELEIAQRTRAQTNLLAVASENRFADRVVNWEECLTRLVEVFKAMAGDPASIDQLQPYFTEVVTTFASNDPAFLPTLLKVWNATEATDSKVRWTYPMIWRDEEFGEMRFLCVVSLGSLPDGTAFNDWHPIDAKTWQVLERVKSRAVGAK